MRGRSSVSTNCSLLEGSLKAARNPKAASHHINNRSTHSAGKPSTKAQALALIRTIQHSSPPALIGEIPLNCFTQTALEGLLRHPTKLSLDF